MNLLGFVIIVVDDDDPEMDGVDPDHALLDGNNLTFRKSLWNYVRPFLIKERSMLPERDPDKPANEQGLFHKFIVNRADGSDAPGGKHHGCEYFVLDVTHDPHAGAALKAYAKSCKETHPTLSTDMMARYSELMPTDLSDGIRELILEALQDFKGNNYEVCQHRWGDATPEYMAQELGHGMTRQQYMDICRVNAERVDRAIAWVNEQPRAFEDHQNITFHKLSGE